MQDKTKRLLVKLLISIIACIIIVLAIYLPLKLTNTLDKITSLDSLKQILVDGGIYSYLIFMLLQFLQVCVLPIPAMIITLAGVYIFGVVPTIILSTISILLASVVAYYIGKKFGKKFIVWLIDENALNKWSEKIAKGKYIYFLMMLFPIFPDDILCFVVGTSGISFKFFIITNIITRPIGIICTCLLGSGSIIPFELAYLPLWIFVGVCLIVAFYFCYKYNDRIENLFNKINNKLLLKSNCNEKQTQEEINNNQAEQDDK